jgi:hypothetical protein
MLRRIFLWVLLITGIVIGLGALGHTLPARQIREALGNFPSTRIQAR